MSSRADWDQWGNKFWVDKHDALHREDGPAIEFANGGIKEWWIHGKLHREDGPAIEYTNGEMDWILNGFYYTFEEWLDLTPRFMEEKVLLKLRYG